MNSFILEIFNYKTKQYEDFSKYACFPPKTANLLDERLDEANVSLMACPTAFFMPNTEARLTFINSPKCRLSSQMANDKVANSETPVTTSFDGSYLTETRVVNFIIASDNATEIITNKPIKKYNHELYLIELTKILEGFICDSLAFTNDLGSNYLTGAVKSYPTDIAGSGYNNIADFDINTFFFDSLKTPFSGQTSLPSLSDISIPIIEKITEVLSLSSASLVFRNRITSSSPFLYSYIKVTDGSTTTDYYACRDDGTELYGINYSPTINTNNQFITVEYSVIYSTNSPLVGISQTSFKFKYTLFVSKNKYPLKKWTITDVINRVFDIVETRRDEEYPLFRLKGVTYSASGITIESGSLADKLNKILAPEFSFTKMTAREILQQIGGFIHGEPFITEKKNDYYEVDFDFYGGNTYSRIKDRPYMLAGFNTDINQYATSLDTSAENLVNLLDYAQGVVCEPYEKGSKTLRSENTTVRMGEENSTVISTALAIEQIGTQGQVRCMYIPISTNENINTNNGEGWDLTPYIFEKADYDNLSSFDGTYPTSKSYALYYEQGRPNIKGLFFRQPTASSLIIKKYAIVNILESLTGRNLENIFTTLTYPKLAFQVTYLPIYKARIKTNKQLVIGGLPRVMAYNQGSNLIEARYYGENLKGVIARLGNVDKTYTYNLAFLSDIPKVGTLFDDNYYISSVSTEYMPTSIKCTISLSKDFNRLSQYVGISSNLRMYEISEKQSQERDTVITDYILITENQNTNDDTFLLNHLGTTSNYNLFARVLLNTNDTTEDRLYNQVTFTRIKFKDINKTDLTTYSINLPTVSTALANSMLFSVHFADNYSAGQRSEYVSEGSISGYYGKNTPYTDYYGRAYYLNLEFRSSTNSIEINNTAALQLPESNSSVEISQRPFYTSTPIIYRKDSREIPSITYEISCVTDDEKTIIGSALTRNCQLVNISPKPIKLYGFHRRLNLVSEKFTTIDGDELTGWSVGANTLTLPNVDGYTAWALITTPEVKTLTVSEEGNETPVTQNIYDGGEVVLGQNKPLNGQVLRFYRKKKLY